MKLKFISNPNQLIEKPGHECDCCCGDVDETGLCKDKGCGGSGTICIEDHFDSGDSKDGIPSLAFELDAKQKIISIVGEYNKEETEEYGVNVFDVINSIELFSSLWEIDWKVSEICDFNGEKYEL